MDRAPDIAPDSEYSGIPPDTERVHVVFLCFGNACRSQMAEGFARARAPEWLSAESAGYYPLGYVTRETIEVMAEKGIDLGGHRSKGLDAIDFTTVSLVVDMAGLSGSVPDYDGKRIVWDIPDPFQGPAEEFRSVRDMIEAKVGELLDGLASEPGGHGSVPPPS